MSAPLPVVPQDLAPHIIASANRHGIPPSVLAALVFKESSWNTEAVRREPTYRWVWDTPNRRAFRRLAATEAANALPPADFKAPDGITAFYEWTSQRTSWGLCQVMGAVARELGFDGLVFADLFDTDRNLELGARLLGRLMRRYEIEDALSAYNAGTPTQANERTYVRPIMRWAAGYKAVGI